MSAELPDSTPEGDEEREKALLRAMFAADVQGALESDNLLQLYVNSFTVNLGTGDVLIVMKRNGKTVASMQVSYTVAKSLAEVLGGLIKTLEDRTGREIMTSKFIEKAMQGGENAAAN